MNTIIEKIGAEIETKRYQNWESENSYYDVSDIKNASICRHKRILCEYFLSFLSNLEKEDKYRLDMTELEIKQKANDLAEAVRHAYITGALDNAKGDSETFAEHYGCLSDTAQEELRPVLPGAAVYEGLSDSLALAFSRYLDSNRGEGKMCLSAWECDDIMKAFRKQDWKRIERYRDKYLFKEND